MKSKLIRYIAAALVVVCYSSCEDFLTQVNPNEMTTDSFWKDLNDTEGGLTAVYNQFRNMDVMGNKYEIPRSDECWPGYARPSTTNEYYMQTFTSSSDGANEKWENIYKGVFRTNQVIKGLKSIEDGLTTDDEKLEWQYQMGQARFFRGLFYHYLHSSFNNGSVLLYNFVPETEEDFNQPLVSADTILKFIRDDLEYALGHLPEKWIDYSSNGSPSNSSDLGRVTSGAAAAVMGTSYLYEKDYTTAASYFKQIIDGGVYRLMDNINDNFTANNEFNQESILEIGYNLNTKVDESASSAEGTANTYNMLYSPIGGYRSVYPANWLIIKYMNDPIDSADARNIVSYEEEVDGVVVKKQRIRKYSLRTSYSIALIDDVDMTYYGYDPIADANTFKNLGTSYWRKMTNWETVSSEKDLLQKSGINYRVIRYADILLMYAECLIKGGTDEAGVEEALKYINRVRYRSALQLLGAATAGEYVGSTYDEVDYSAQDVMEHLMYKERPLELSAEGYAIRQIDLRRWGITKERFEDLASRVYWADQYVFLSAATGKNKTKYSAILKEEYNPDYTKDLSEFKQAAVNYREDDHAYWPVPTGEVTANSMID
ncbi:RagB/SusD family nutrient uptake outer membrane protein [Saccharicrinis fermentans]|uniref:SusD family protein n=1 Tax=Saccharicrinis fermentans DSM 9555 = JCM 21142 TaxID=869213 RepID=W7YMM5_9BACT|nr:RagB/SusD family nutrient uptake outer membrane protein [Saccharicrinis fermentans]GAF03644.1 SusD family protein [Saccharicrinis fermentans DSM 9555 = JCM 21142]